MLGAKFLGSCAVLLGVSSVLAATPTLSDARLVTNQFQFQLNGEAGQAYILQASRDLTNWSGVLTNVLETNVGVFSLPATNTSGNFRAKVAAPIFNHAVLAQYLDPQQYTVVSDSFDSADPRFSTAGQYDPAKRRDGGDIASYHGLNMGNSQIAGKVWTGPQGSVELGPSGSVGTLAWVDSGQTGIQPGHWSTNFQERWPDIQPPFGGYKSPLVNAIVDGEYYNFVFTNGNYLLSSFRFTTGKVLVLGKCAVIVTRLFSLSSNVLIRLQSADSALHLYLFTTDAQFSAQMQGVVTANQFIIFGQPTCVSLAVSMPNFTGVIYAPNAVCNLTTTSVVGACAAHYLRLKRSVSFHFDENLKRVVGYY
jgi:hypothetical protein